MGFIRKVERPLVLRALLLAFIGYSVFIFHGLSNHLDPWSQALINAAVKFAYGKTGQDDITVVLFREENLAELNTHYPVPYRLHSDVIEAIATYQPKAVFVDFAFIDNRDPKAIDELANALCTLKESGASVFLAAPLGNGKVPTITPELLRCAKPALPDMDRKSGESGVLTYFHGRKTDNGFVPSAAFALAQDRLNIDPEKAEKLEIVWGKGVAPLNLKWMNCEEQTGWALLKSTLFENPLANRLDCPYHRTISANHLLNSVGDDDIQQALEGRTVFYGAGFRFTGDRVESPVYGEMPGIYLHTMAYDNLLTFGENYKRADRHGVLVRLIDMALLLIASFLLVFVRAPEKSEADSLIDFIHHAQMIFVGFAFVAVIMGIAMTFGLDIACLTGAALYVVYRGFIQHDPAFLLLVVITLATTIFGYYELNLGPRNILAFVAFFEVVGHFQDKLVKKAKTYFEFRDKFLLDATTDEETGAPPLPLWDKLLAPIFWLFYQPDPKETKP